MQATINLPSAKSWIFYVSYTMTLSQDFCGLGNCKPEYVKNLHGHAKSFVCILLQFKFENLCTEEILCSEQKILKKHVNGN